MDEQDFIRTHMRVFLDGDELRDPATVLDGKRTLHVVQALSSA